MELGNNVISKFFSLEKHSQRSYSNEKKERWASQVCEYVKQTSVSFAINNFLAPFFTLKQSLNEKVAIL